jgi:hypothetical protein
MPEPQKSDPFSNHSFRRAPHDISWADVEDAFRKRAHDFVQTSFDEIKRELRQKITHGALALGFYILAVQGVSFGLCVLLAGCIFEIWKGSLTGGLVCAGGAIFLVNALFVGFFFARFHSKFKKR